MEMLTYIDMLAGTVEDVTTGDRGDVIAVGLVWDDTGRQVPQVVVRFVGRTERFTGTAVYRLR